MTTIEELQQQQAAPQRSAGVRTWGNRGTNDLEKFRGKITNASNRSLISALEAE
jgi:hypothetical protein